MIFAAGLVFNALYVYQMRFYYANSDFLKLGFIRASMLVIKLVLSFVLISKFQHNGLAVATICAWIIGFIVMSIDLNRLVGISLKDLIYPIVIKIFAALVITALFWTTVNSIVPTYESKFLLAIRLSILGGGGLVVYLWLAKILKIPYPAKIYSIIIGKFKSTA